MPDAVATGGASKRVMAMPVPTFTSTRRSMRSAPFTASTTYVTTESSGSVGSVSAKVPDRASAAVVVSCSWPRPGLDTTTRSAPAAVHDTVTVSPDCAARGVAFNVSTAGCTATCACAVRPSAVST